MFKDQQLQGSTVLNSTVKNEFKGTMQQPIQVHYFTGREITMSINLYKSPHSFT